ncbi:MAG: methylenetetrahydrofolate reductase [Candidatus Omnitrophica bacterium]|nr:methylenetetrahydrofolate reductase [Candidatus Omnitrophota bacterium]MBU1127543.1 methylenetetrahydrofolate reductase [Candidatus Omnitrophota bacterium]MBU1784080.1 methylenetetrahydrofolate reductase [Candidatus Omnitrophota bacterium]MBU1851388.1 methylenetetrahydrofolate reductase [Candidatus Omnitrophota bacterium]
MKKFREKLQKGEFVYTTEVGPPKGVCLSGVFEELQHVAGRVDAVNVTDQQSAVMRLGPIVTGKAILDKGFEPICQFTCRDRNRIALQSDLLSAASLGIKNVLIMTGDHPLLGDHPQAKPVYDLDSVSMLEAVKTLQEGRDLAGKALTGSPDFYVGAVVNPGANPLEPEIIKMEKKVSCGAVFFQTQAIFDVSVFERFIAAIKHLRKDIKLLGGIVPLKSAGMARYMNANIPGVLIPDAVIESLDKATDVQEESAEIASNILGSIRDMCDGVHFMPIRANHLVAKILDRL